MLSFSLDDDTEKRVAARARAVGLAEVEFLRALIDEALDDLDDIQMATDRLNDPLPPLTSTQARQALGLED